MGDLTTSLLTFLMSRRGDGTRRFSPEAVRHALPGIVFDLLQGASDVEVPAEIEQVVVAWMTARGLVPTSSFAAVVDALDATYAERPVDPELLLGLAELMRNARPQGERLRSFFGDGAAMVRQDGPPPAGAVPLMALRLGAKKPR